MSSTTTEKRLSRRDALRGAGAGAVAATVMAATPRQASAAVTSKPQLGMVIDARRCIGCHSCSVACKAEFDTPLGYTRSWVEYVEKGNFPNVSRAFLPRLCNQCSDPQCVSVCPTGATWKRDEDGIVVVDAEVCIGCKYCLQACPYDARFINPISGSADKCDFCLHRTTKGTAPACVTTCIGRARVFGDLNDPSSEVARLIAGNNVTVLRKEMGTKPNVYYISADHSDEADARHSGQYIRVTTHRREKQRR